MDGITDLMDMSLSNLWEMVKDRDAWLLCLQSMGSQRVGHDSVTEQQLEDESFPGGSDGKESAGNVGDSGLIPGLGRSPGEGILHCSCLEDPMDREAWWATVHRVTKSWTWLSNQQFRFHWKMS